MTTVSPNDIVQTGMVGVPDMVLAREAHKSSSSDETRCERLSGPGAVLAEIFEEIHTVISDDWMAFRALVHILGDATRLHPLEHDLRSIADRIGPLFRPFVIALESEDPPFDPLGEVFTHFEVADGHNSGGQVLTPRWICEYINDHTVGKRLEQIASGEKEVDRPIITLDPAAGTGRFPIDIAQRYGNLQQDVHPIRIYAVEKNLWLYRACLVNVRLMAPLEPIFVLWGDSLLLDLSPSSLNWLAANRWYPVDWRELTPMHTRAGDGSFDLCPFALACGGPEPKGTEYVSLDTWEERTGCVLSSPESRGRG